MAALKGALLAVAVFLLAAHARVEGKSKCAALDLCEAKAFRTCSCDEDCHQFGTCCVDADEAVKSGGAEFQCYERGTQTPVFVKRRCAVGSGEEVCSTPPPHPFLVSSSRSNATYLSRECALCNHEEESGLLPWTSQLTCPSRYVSGNDSSVPIAEEDLPAHLTFDTTQQAWGLSMGDEFVPCSLHFQRPVRLFHRLHYCAPNMVSSCPPDYGDPETARRCLEYHGERKDKKRPVYYKNVDCALCNGAPFHQLECVGRNYGPVPQQRPAHNIVRVILREWKWVERSASGHRQCRYSFSTGLHCEKMLPQTNLLVNAANRLHLLLSMSILFCHVCFRAIL